MEERIVSHVGLRNRFHVLSMLLSSSPGPVFTSLESGDQDLMGSVYVVPFLTKEAREKSLFCHWTRTKLRDEEWRLFSKQIKEP